MGTLWTPDGERRVGEPAASPPPPAGGEAVAGPGAGPVSEAEMEARMAELRQQLAQTPAAVVVANHCFGLFELAALHLSLQPPQLVEAQVAIDALGAVLEGLEGRLGDEEATLREGLAQLRLAYVQISSAGPGS